ncbi:MAG: hypothetical protein ACOC4M_10770 [Promethearchaeia archaeon]
MIYFDIQCPRCGANELKLIGNISNRDQWQKRAVSYRCVKCGYKGEFVLRLLEIR